MIIRVARAAAASALLAFPLVAGPPASAAPSSPAALEAPSDQITVQGTVFRDLNGDGRRDAGERGLPGVSVTDGQVWATTGRDGAYSIAIDGARRLTDLVQIVSPDGYTPALRDDYVPRFFQRVPDGDGPPSGVDFGLVPDRHAADPRETWLMPSDTETDNRSDTAAADTKRRWKSQVQSMARSNATVAIATGDLNVTDYAEAPRRQGGYDLLREGLKAGKLGIPFYPVMGNHDAGAPGQDAPGYAANMETWRRNMGPEWYSFDRNGRHHVVLENNYDTSGLAPQLEWLREDLKRNARGKQVMVYAHRSLFTQWGPGRAIQPIIDELAEYDVRMFAAGHDQQAEFRRGAFPRSVEINNMGTTYGIDGARTGYKLLDFSEISGRHDTGNVKGVHRQFDVRQDTALVSPGQGAAVAAGRPVPIEAFAEDTGRTPATATVTVTDSRGKVIRRERKLKFGAGASRAGVSRPGVQNCYTPPGGKPEPCPARRTSWTRAQGQSRALSPGTYTARLTVVGTDGAAWPAKTSTFKVTKTGADGNGTLNLGWTANTGEQFNLNGSVITGGKVIVSSRALDSPYSMMLAYDAATGREVWRTYLDGDAESAPIVHDGRVFITTAVGRVYALNVSDGKVAWQQIDMEEQHGTTVRRYGRAGGPVSVFALKDGSRSVAVYQEWDQVVCRDAATGTRLAGGFKAPAGWGQFHSAAVREPGTDTAYLHSGSSQSLIAMNLAGCTQLWTADTGGSIYSHSSPALTQAGQSGATRLVSATMGGVYGHDLNGKELWHAKLEGDKTPESSPCEPGPPPVTSPSVLGRYAYVASRDGAVRAFDLQAADPAKPVWETPVGYPQGENPKDDPARGCTVDRKGSPASNALATDKTVYAGAWDGRLLALDRATGRVTGSYDLGGGVASALTIGGGRLYALTTDGTIHSLTVKE